METDSSSTTAPAPHARLKSWRAVVSAKHSLLSRCLALLVTLALTAAIMLAWPKTTQTARPFKRSAEVQSVVDANTAFAIDLYQRLKSGRENLFFSPYSISAALAMTYAGARGQTGDEMARVLHFDSADDVHGAFAKLTKRLNNLQRWRRITLLDADSIWCQKDYSFAGDFLKLIHKDYNAEARAVDFLRAPDVASRDINSWVSDKTDGKINGLIQPGQLTPDSRLVLCNAIYFKGRWQTQFRAEKTRPRPFYIKTNETVEVPMMSLHAHFKITCADNDSIGLLELPYVGNDLSMVILLPVAGSAQMHSDTEPESRIEQPQTLSDLEAKLTAQNLGSWLAQLDHADVSDADIDIPRFTTTQTFDLSQELKSLGMATAFGDTADFSGMDGTHNLYISGVVHQAFVEVDETGTVAAAATSVSMISLAMPMEQVFVVDHPFVFLIRDNASGAILFFGRIVNPAK